MNENLDKLTMKSILSADSTAFTHFESKLAKRFNIPEEQLRKLLIESESLEEFLARMNLREEV